jgi:signal transduction histidine kinase/CHASE1-domain containing sensor protein/ActR/RegA family two-component response regulator
LLRRDWANLATRWAAWTTLLLALALTTASWRFAHQRAAQEAQAELHIRGSALASRIEERMLAYEQLLRGGVGLFAAAGGTVGREDWRAFIDSLGLETLPGIEGIGFAQRLEPAEVATHERTMQAGGMAQYRVFPQGERETFTAIVLLEPLHGRNLRAIGFDMYSESTRRNAMQRARDTGTASLSGRVVLVQEGPQARQPGFLLYLPVYRRDAQVDTVEGRRDALLGWVYAPFRMGDFVRGIFGDGPLDVRLEIRDARNGGSLLYESGSLGAAPDLQSMSVGLRMADRIWNLAVESRPRAGTAWLRPPHLVALGGLTISLLIFAIVRTLAGTRSRAVAIADRMTEALRTANETLEERVRERTASLRETNARLGRVNARLRAMAGAVAAINASGTLAGQVGTIAMQARSLLDCELAVATMRNPDPDAASGGGEPLVGIDAAPSIPPEVLEGWRAVALDPTQSGDALRSGPRLPGMLEHRIHVPLHDSAQRTRGHLVLGRDSEPFSVEDATVLSQLSLLIAGSVSLHETLAREQHARARAERADRAKDEMLAVVSHELRTPLNAIQGWLHVLRRRRANDIALLDRAVDVIQRNLDTQVQVVDDLLDTARIVSGKLRLALRRLDLVTLLRSAVEVVRPLTEAKQLRLDVLLPEGPLEMVGDAARLEQVVWNLLNNAVKFTPVGGAITVRLRGVNGTARLDVEDTGIGIDPSFLPHVFDRFQQADSSSTRNAGGLGLGLSLVQHIVHGHGGEVIAASKGTGHGACFSVMLPLQANDDATSEGRQDLDRFGPQPLQGMQLLVVEDHDDSRELLVEFLASQGAHVQPAASSDEALQQRRAVPRGVRPFLICDIALPGESGYDVLARIREIENDEDKPAGERTVALALSAFTREEDRQRSIAAGFVAHLTKPASQPELVARLLALRQSLESGPTVEARTGS